MTRRRAGAAAATGPDRNQERVANQNESSSRSQARTEPVLLTALALAGIGGGGSRPTAPFQPAAAQPLNHEAMIFGEVKPGVLPALLDVLVSAIASLGQETSSLAYIQRKGVQRQLAKRWKPPSDLPGADVSPEQRLKTALLPTGGEGCKNSPHSAQTQKATIQIPGSTSFTPAWRLARW